MKYEFYFADLKLSVVLEAEAEDVFAQLTDNEYLCLQQIVYQGLNTFLLTKALSNADNAIEKKHKGCTDLQCTCTCHGG